jgi:hypothetical protein
MSLTQASFLGASSLIRTMFCLRSENKSATNVNQRHHILRQGLIQWNYEAVSTWDENSPITSRSSSESCIISFGIHSQFAFTQLGMAISKNKLSYSPSVGQKASLLPWSCSKSRIWQLYTRRARLEDFHSENCPSQPTMKRGTIKTNEKKFFQCELHSLLLQLGDQVQEAEKKNREFSLTSWCLEREAPVAAEPVVPGTAASVSVLGHRLSFETPTKLVQKLNVIRMSLVEPRFVTCQKGRGTCWVDCSALLW